MQKNFSIKELAPETFEAALIVARSLPQWFTSGGLTQMRKDAEAHRGIVAFEGTQPVGFLFYFVKQGLAEISWMGVLPTLHRQGLGKALLQKMNESLKSRGIQSVFVKTLGDSVEYEPYAKTRAFYRKCGFEDFNRKMQPENPEMEEELTLRLQL